MKTEEAFIKWMKRNYGMDADVFSCVAEKDQKDFINEWKDKTTKK